MDFAYTIAGFAVGAIVGLTGVGGGSLMTPLLVLMFGIHPSVAVGTDLLYAAITKAGGTLAHGLKGTVDWKITRLLATGSLPAAAITLVLIGHFAPGGIEGAAHLIKVALGVALVLTAVALIFRKRIQAYAVARSGGRPADPARTARLTILTGAVLGVLVSISSVGAGALGVNSFLWRGTLDTLDFMPLVSADPFGGLIITDWYQPPESPSERLKLQVLIRDRVLRADGLKVAVFRQVREGDAWVDAAVDPATATSLEDKILTRARELRIASADTQG